jgi:hypothetical protein
MSTQMRVPAARGKVAALIVLLVLVVGGCRRESPDGAEALTSSLMFDNASPEAREALASHVDFRITDDNFARWEAAQNNLDALPRSAIRPASTAGANAVDRAVARLESSPRARRAIERAGLSVREFVLATIALAQATEAAQTGKSTSPVPVPPENFQFVQRYAARVLRSRQQERIARAEATYDVEFDTAGEMADTAVQLHQIQSEQGENHAEQQADTVRDPVQPPVRDTVGEPVQDSVRDTVPALR